MLSVVSNVELLSYITLVAVLLLIVRSIVTVIVVIVDCMVFARPKPMQSKDCSVSFVRTNHPDR